MPDTQMMKQDAAAVNTLAASTVESVLLGGDLSKLSPQARVTYYTRTCESLGLNYLTRPFDYITLNGKLTLYARKDAADQLRKLHGISIDKPDITFQEDWIIVNVLARTPEGRTDADTGVVNKKDMRGDFGNALMKAVTKAKRRVTLSICGLGMLDETEIETVPFAQPVAVDTQTGEIRTVATVTATTPPPKPAPAREPGDEPDDIGYAFGPDDDMPADHLGGATNPREGRLRQPNVGDTISEARQKRLFAIAKSHGWSNEAIKTRLQRYGFGHTRDIPVAKYDDIVAMFEEVAS